MAATPSIKIVKEFDYKGSLKRWSNRYHFNGGTPGDPSEWATLAENVMDDERGLNHSDVTIVGWAGYEAGTDAPVASDSVSLVCVGDFATSAPAPGDCASLVRYSTTARTSKNHPIYLANFYHGTRYSTDDPPDALAGALKTALEAYADHWLAGFSDGVHTLVRSGPNGATAISRHVAANITHRDFRS